MTRFIPAAGGPKSSRRGSVSSSFRKGYLTLHVVVATAACKNHVAFDASSSSGEPPQTDAGCLQATSGSSTTPHGTMAVDLGASVAVYPPGVTNGTQPLGALSGCATRLDGLAANALTFGGDGRLYVARNGAASGGAARVVVFAAGALGNAAPVATLSGPSTRLDASNIGALAVDSQGLLYVAQWSTASSPGRVLVFDSGADGDLAPRRTLSGQHLGTPSALAFDLTGNLYVADSEAQSVEVFAPGASGGAAAIRTIGGTVDPVGISVDADGSTYVSDQGNALQGVAPSIRVYAASATGNTPPERVITGASTGLIAPLGIALDAVGTLYVVDHGAEAVLLFPVGGAGNVPSIAVASGAEAVAVFR